MSRQDQWQITVSVGGTTLGVFDSMDGGDVDSSETKYKPGGMAPQVSLGGTPEVANVTVKRLYSYDRDHELARRLSSRVGKDTMSVAKQPLDQDGNPKGRAIIYGGKLKKVTHPSPDSNSSGTNMLELEMSTVGNIA